MSRSRNLRHAVMVLGALALAISPAVSAAPPPSSIAGAIPGCACDADRAQLLERWESITAAASVDEARSLALADVESATRALSRARWFAPFSDDLVTARERLERYGVRVAAADSSPAVAAEFASLVKLPRSGARVLGDIDLDDDVDLNIDAGCSFSGGEVIAIVLGLILGIIPGLILLILLC